LATSVVRLADPNWLGDAALEAARDLPVAVRVRSTREPRPATLTWNPDTSCAEVALATPEDGVSPGQACVIYADDGPRARVLGGGTIRRVEAESLAAA
ncbi:aminomethyltransferase beta-barrel domain-containing protein, partial [Methylobacterium ajmalii]